MPKQKVKNGKRKEFFLDEETIQEIKRNANLMGLSESAYIDFLITREKISLNPILQIKEIQIKKEELQEKLKELDLKEKLAIQDAEKIHEWQELKRTKKQEAVNIIQKKILIGDYEYAEEIAKTWSRIVGIPAIDLLAEAQKNINKGI